MDVAYKGTAYHGWQIQPNAITVQEVMQDCMSTILRHEHAVTGSGRTDAGVHALKQVVHFDLQAMLPDGFMYKLNSLLPPDISVSNLLEVHPEAHARFDADNRGYEYRIIRTKSPFSVDEFTRFTYELDFQAMNEAAKVLLNHTDFECFSKVHTDVNTFNCDIRKAEWKQEGEFLTFYIEADRFLRGMVRAIVGTLLEIGRGQRPVEDMQRILESRDRSMAGKAVPAKGLFLAVVDYPKSVYKL